MVSARFWQAGLSRLRSAGHSVFGVAAFGVAVNADPASEAQCWLDGAGDLLFAGLRGWIPLTVRLGVLAHADIGRLADLGRYSRRGSVCRAWGAEMAGLAGEIARQAGTQAGLADLQRGVLKPLELELLAGRLTFTSARSLADHVRGRLAAVEASA